MTTIRTRTPDDLPGCVAALAQVHNGSGYPSNWPSDPARWLTPRRMEQAWVACGPDGTVIGHALVSTRPDSPGEAEFGRLFVAPAARGQGAATALIAAAARWVADTGRSMWLEVNAESEPAIAVYGATGWRLTETVTAEWTHPDGSPVTLHRFALAL